MRVVGHKLEGEVLKNLNSRVKSKENPLKSVRLSKRREDKKTVFRTFGIAYFGH